MKNAKNVKKAILWTVAVVALAVVIMAAYYGISMFQLQNNIKLLDTMALSFIGVLCAYVAIRTSKKEKTEETTA